MEIVIRAAVMWIFVLIVLRAMGRKELSQLSPFELVLLVVIGDLIQQGVTEQDYSVTAAMLAVSTLALLTLAFSYISYRWSSASRFAEGVSVVLIRDGRVQHKALEVERLTLDELKDAAREQGIADLREIRLGILEADGEFSFLRSVGPTETQQRSGETQVE
ncbi:MAG: DUF421 domain-containing protein [Candidatus Velamenicoccus archaeovorus]